MSDKIAPRCVKQRIEQTIAELIQPHNIHDRRAHFWGNFENLGSLGSGAEASVRKMRDNSTGAVVAIKQVKQRYWRGSRIPQAHREVRILALLVNVGSGDGQSTIIRPLETLWFPCTPNDREQSLLLEYCELGTLRNYIDRRAAHRLGFEFRFDTLHEGFYRNVYLQLMAGVAFLHYGFGTDAYDALNRRCMGRNAVLHRDIKPDNILVCPAAPGDHQALIKIKLADFGGALEAGTTDDDHAYCFTRNFCPPEFFNKRGMARSSANTAWDVYAAGATMHWCIFGRAPWVARGHRLSHKPLDISKRYHKGGELLSNDFSDRVQDALNPHLDRRCDAIQIYERLKTDHETHMQAYTRWCDEIEVSWPRLQGGKKERKAAEAHERACWLAHEVLHERCGTAAMRQGEAQSQAPFLPPPPQHFDAHQPCVCVARVPVQQPRPVPVYGLGAWGQFAQENKEDLKESVSYGSPMDLD